MDECEVCNGQFGIIPMCTVTFTADDTGEVTSVRMCRECLAAVFTTMVHQWNSAIAAGNAAVDAICKQLGIEFPQEADSDG